MQTIAERLKTAQDKIAHAAASVNRPLNSIKLLAVSKTKPVSDIKQAYDAGQRFFGENYIQEGVEKIQNLASLEDIEWHLIGPIQSNKTAVVAQHFDWVQSVDRSKIARRLNTQRPDYLPPLNVCIQVNIDNEDTKSGVLERQLDDLIREVDSLTRLNLRGLMAIPSPHLDADQQMGSLKRLRALFEQYQIGRPQFDTLSVGMSSDTTAAIENGSTMVRIGTAIFGARSAKPSNQQ